MNSRQDAKKQEVLAQIVTLAAENGISLGEIESALTGNRLIKTGGGIAMRIFSILGGIFIFSGISTYIGMFWGEMNSAMRVIITLGSGFAVYILGIAFSRDPKRVSMVAPVMLAAAIMESGGLFVLIYEYFNNNTHNWRFACLIVFGIMFSQQGLTFLARRIPIMLLTTLWFGSLFFAVTFDMLGLPQEWNTLIIGFSLLATAYGIAGSEYQRSLQIVYLAGLFTFFSGIAEIFRILHMPEWGMVIVGGSLLSVTYGVRGRVHPSTLSLSYLVGAFCFLFGWFDVLKETVFEGLYIAIACLMIYFSVIIHSTTLLVLSVLAMLSYIGYFTAEHFVNSAGWPVALIVIGVLFSAISAGALRIKKKYIS
jgi:hypothetical protein